jgi:hypothetical protein
MTRRLLPYEHQLITELGISEQEYLNFVQAQFDHTKLPADKLKEPQNWETVAIVLTIVGVLFQVGAALLAPKPELPSQQNQRRRRDQVFAPRFGFNSAQDLAKYGDPVNLVYCNVDQNTTGGVRVATSLVWSAVQSLGSSQFMQMMAVIGASNISADGVAFERTAFGQTPVRQFSSHSFSLYFRQNGIVRFSDLKLGSTADPTRTGENNNAYAYRSSLIGTQRIDGFSQAFSPSSLTKFGVTAPIPINVNYYDRSSTGQARNAPFGIEIADQYRGGYWPTNRLDNSRAVVPVGHQMVIRFSVLPPKDGDGQIRQAAGELRRALINNIDLASTYKLGSAHFRVVGPLDDLELEQDGANIKIECVQSGLCPEEDYGTVNFNQNGEEAANEVIRLNAEIAELDRLLTLNEPLFKPGFEDAANAQLEELRARKQQLADLTDKQWSDEELESILDGSIAVDGPVRQAAAILDDIRQQRRDVQYKIDDGLAELADLAPGNARQRKREAVNKLKAELVDWNNRVKKAQTRLDRRVERYGLADKVYDWNYEPNNRRTAKQERAYIIDREKDILNGLYQRAAESGNLDQSAMDTRNAGWSDQKSAKVNERAYYQSVIDNPERDNDFFNTKCLVKIEEASYETITQCRIVDFAVKARVFKRIQGRQKQYGEVTMDNYKDSDNGNRMRSAFFWLLYRRTGNEWSRVPRIFVVRRGQDLDNFVSLKFIADDNIGNWQFKFEPIADTAAEMRYHGLVDFAYLEGVGSDQEISGQAGGKFTFKGKLRSRDGYLSPVNRNPSQVDEWGLFSMRSDTQLSFSFDNGPEFEIKAVTEQSTESFENYPALYRNLTMLGFNVFSGQGVQDLRSTSVFVNKGKLVRQLNDDGSYSNTQNVATSYAPEIFLDTIIDTVDGIGQYAKIAGIDLVALAKAKRFCQRNNLFFDGVIAEPTSWRQFWAETAPYSLLELGRIGGKETLIPAVPCDNAGNITRTVPITAMFTAGNILEDSYKEEFIDYGSSVQDLIATIIYRSTERDGVFPRNASVDVSLTGATEASAIRQTFDLSQYVTNRSQAIMYAKLLCQQRRHIRRNVEFRTFPTDSPLTPGAYIYVDIGQQDWQSIYSGQIENGGVLNIPLAETVPNGTYSVLLYRSGQSVISTSASISGNVASSLAGYEGWLFVLGTAVKAKRVFRIVEVQMDEEGEVSVRATEHPCDASGQSLIADFSDGLFSIR